MASSVELSELENFKFPDFPEIYRLTLVDHDAVSGMVLPYCRNFGS